MKSRTARKFLSPDDLMMSDISITPLVDCAFTILIIFMILAPIVEHGLSIQLPQSKAKKIESQESLSVEVDSRGWIFLDGQRVTEQTLISMLMTLAQTKENLTVYLKADRANSYGTIVGILDTIKESGIENIGLVTQEKQAAR